MSKLKLNPINFLSEINSAKTFAIFLILGLIAYGNSLLCPFIQDDIVFIQNNPDIKSWSNISSLFLQSSSFFNASTIANPYYRPLLDLLTRTQYHLFGSNPFYYHLFNLLVHIINTFLAFLILNSLTANKRLSLCVSILFLTYPAQVSSVSFIAGVSNLMYSFFCLLGFIFYLESVRKSQTRFGLLPYAASLMFFIISLFVKEQAVVFPFLIILYEICINRSPKDSVQKKFMRLIGIFAIFLNYLLFRRIILGVTLSSFMAYKGELFLRILAMPRILLKYLIILFFPVNLSFYNVTDILEPYILPLVGLLGVFVFIFLMIRSMSRSDRRIAIFAVGWFLITLLPVLNIIPMVVEYSFLWTPDHFIYLSTLGFFLLAGLIIGSFFQPALKGNSKTIAITFLILINMVFIVMTMRNNTYLKGEVSLFEKVVKHEKRVSRFHTWLAQAYFAHQRFDEAIAEYKVALGILEGYTKRTPAKEAKRYYQELMKGIHLDLAGCYEAENDYSSAIVQYSQALDAGLPDSVIYTKLGLNYLRLSTVDQAILAFEKAIQLDSKNAMALNDLAVCYIQIGRLAQAKELLHQAIDIDNNFNPAKENLKKLLGQ